MKYNDPVYGEIEITLIDTIIRTDGDIENTEEIYEYPTGDLLIRKETKHTKVDLQPFLQEFFVKRAWIDSSVKNSVLKTPL